MYNFTRWVAFVIAHDNLYQPDLPEVSPSFCHDGLAHSQSYNVGLAHIELHPEVSPSFCHDGLTHSQFYDDGLAHTKLYLRSRPRSAMMVSPTASSMMMVSPSTWSTMMSLPLTVSPSSSYTPFRSCVTSFYIPPPLILLMLTPI